MIPAHPLSRRRLILASVGLALASHPAAGAVRVIRGSRSGKTERQPNDREDRGHVIRPGQTRDSSPTAPLSDMLAEAPTRAVLLDHAHTGERLDLTYWREGRFDQSANPVLGWFLRDWRQSRPSPLSISLLDTIWAVQTQLASDGTAPAFRILSAFRTRQTNEALIRAGVAGVAKDSFHLRGMAIDLHCPQRPYRQLEATCLSLVPGGIGLYRGAGFIHLDSGPNRRWVG